MSKLKGKIAVVTGGNSGIGLATAKIYKAEGATVIITARSPETYVIAQRELGKVFDVQQVDVSKPSDLDRFYGYVRDKYGRIDVLFANAGIAHFRPTEQVDEEFFDSHFNTNVKGLYFSVAKAASLFTEGAAVVLNASAVTYKGIQGSSVYSATKAAVRSFARTWAAEFASRRIRVNVLSPGPIETPIFQKMNLPQAEADKFAAGMQAKIALGRFGTPDEMARTALFLSSSDSSFITGIDVVADGGYSQI